jgi:three-Cys-motif partner protein
LKKSHAENTVGPWARQKLDGLEAYLNAYTTALKKQPFELIYVDAFAGAGRSKLRCGWTEADDDDVSLLDDEFLKAEEQFIEGSPRRALSLETPFKRYYFFDADPGRAALLQQLSAEYPDQEINVDVGDANGLIQALAPRLNSRLTRGVAFLDPYGPHLDWRTLEILGRTKKFEVIINFPLGMAINRLITRSGDIPTNWRSGLNACFGGSDWEGLVYAETTDLFGGTTRHKVDDAAQRLLAHYRNRLEALFGCAAKPSVVRNSRGMPIYYMLWAGPHPLGLKIADYVLAQGDRISPPKKRSQR